MKINLKEVITIDFETYWASDFSLASKTLNTSEYIRDPQFKAHCCAIKIGTGKTRVIPHNKLKAEFAKIDWKKYDLLAHNTSFDGAILAWHYGHIPRRYLDTVSMTRALHGDMTRASLDTIAKFYGIGAKSETYLTPTKGLRELPPDVYKGLAEGCAIDNDLCFEVFKKQIEVYPEDEIELIDLTIRMFTEPQLEVDVARAKRALEYEMDARMLSIALSRVDEKVLSSSTKFAQALRDVGCEPPMKWSQKQQAMTYAFAQNDPEFIELLEHDDIRVVRLVQGRLAAKSTIIETRAHRLIKAGENGQKLPVLLNYSAAKTHRWGGANKLNLQNLNRQEYDDKGKPIPMTGELRKSILAPEGHVVLVADSAQIEARTLAWWAGQEDLVQAFANNEDVYKKQASAIYGVPVDQINKEQRFVGKVCLAEGSLILSDRGWIAIETLQRTDKLWDGDDWVCHHGLAMNGFRETLNLSGLWLTPDHLVWSGAEWKEAQCLEADDGILCQALAFAAENLPLPDTSKARAVGSLHSSSTAIAGTPNTPSIGITSKTSKALAVMFALSKRLVKSVTGSIQTPCLTTNIEQGYSTGYLQPSLAVIEPRVQSINTMERAGLKSSRSGDSTALVSSGMSNGFRAGMTRLWRWIASTQTTAIDPETYDSSLAQSTRQTKEKSQTSRKKCAVYDALSVGPKNRFVALTARGPVMVHNCILGLGYGMGAPKFRTTLALGSMGPPVHLSMALCKTTVNTYRTTNYMIPRLWREAEKVLTHMAAGGEGQWGILEYDAQTIWLPNGMGLHYPRLKVLWDGEKNRAAGFEYMANGHPKKIYGGLLVENITQALARIIVASQMLGTRRYFRTLKLKKGEVAQICSMSHDEIISVVPARIAKTVLAKQLSIMRTPPAWAEDLPLNAEGGYAKNYSK